jgi:uncharacterized protein GlcG (DUF336 family)
MFGLLAFSSRKNQGRLMSSITLAKANAIVDGAIRKRQDLKLAPMTVAVLDTGGHLVALKREDGSGILRVELACGKAYGALGMGFGSREIAERAQKQQAFYTALFAASQGRVVPAPGGVLIRDAGGGLLGAVGISGDTGENDEICAVAGVEAAGLKGQTGMPQA